MTTTDALPDRNASDEDRYDQRPSALCEACEERPGAVAEDGAWLCLICSSALETAAAIDALRRLIVLKDGPRDEDYRLEKHRAWAAARAAVDAYETETGTWDAWFDRHPGHMVNGYCLSHPPGCNRRCLDDRPQGPAPWEPAA